LEDLLEKGIFFSFFQMSLLRFGGIVHDNLLGVMICNIDINLIVIIFVKLNHVCAGKLERKM